MKASAILGTLIMPAIALSQTADQHAQPPPQFTNYRIPAERAALPRDGAYQYVDLAILAIVLGLTAWIVLTRRSRRELRVVSIFSLAYFGFYRLGCVCAIGSIQNVTYGAIHSDYKLPLTVAGFFILPLLAALFFGRVFCGGACPMGALQELVLLRRVKLPAWISSPLEMIPYLYLGAAVLFAATGTAFAICEYDPFVALFRMHGHFLMVLFGAMMVVLSMFVGRPYCRFLCPYGVLLRWCSAFARASVTVSPKECIQCHLCANACPFDAIKAPRNEIRDRDSLHKRIAMTLAAAPILISAFAFAGWRLSPKVASWDERVHRAQVLRRAEVNPSQPKTVIADAWDRHRHTKQEAYQIAAAVEKEFAVGTPLLGAWVGLVISLKALFSVRRKMSNDYLADAGSCVSCARCFDSCPIPHRSYPLQHLPIADRELAGGSL